MTDWTDETATERKDRKRHSALIQFKHANMLMAINELFKSEAGREFLTYLIFGHGAVGINAFTEDDRTTNFLLGKQSLGHEVMALALQANPQRFAEIMKEHFDARPKSEPDSQPDSDSEPGPGIDGPDSDTYT